MTWWVYLRPKQKTTGNTYMLYRTRCPFATTYFSYKCCYFQILQPCIGMNMVTYPVCHWWIDNNKSATEGLSHTKLVYMSIKGWTSWVWPPWIGFSQINSNTLPMLCPIQLPNWGITHTDLVFVSWESFPGFKGHVGKSFHQCPQESLPFDDLWEDAGVPSILEYIGSNKHLEVPASWKEHFLP